MNLEESEVLLVGPVGEVIDGESVTEVLGVGSYDDCIVGLEESLSKQPLICIGVCFMELSHVVCEVVPHHRVGE